MNPDGENILYQTVQLSREMFSVKAQKLASELFVHQKSTKPRILSEVLLVIKTENMQKQCTALVDNCTF